MAVETVATPAPAGFSVREGLASTGSSVLDYLRAFAVLLVFVSHILEATRNPSFWWQAQEMGWVGVMLFFVHTSLVLMFSLDRARLDGAGMLANFYLRRALRIYPLSIAIVVTILLFHIPVASWPWRPVNVTTGTVAANLLLVQNLVYAPSVLGPLWSLPLELQMYAFLPFLYWLVRRGTRLDRAAVLWVLALGGALVQPFVSGRANVAQFAPCFMGGILAFCLSKRRPAIWPFWIWVVTLGIAMIGFFAATSNQAAPHVMGASWGLTLAIGLLVPNFAETRSPLVRRATATIAKYSYGIYLTHMITFWIVFAKLSHASLTVRLLLGTILSVALPMLAYHLVEAPGIRIGARLATALASRMTMFAVSSPEPDSLLSTVRS
jgi:peptidoglycan/LPS O-acetylase OafA/YrhL